MNLWKYQILIEYNTPITKSDHCIYTLKYEHYFAYWQLKEIYVYHKNWF